MVGSLLEAFPDEFEAHADRTAAATEPHLVAELLDIDGYEAVLDQRFLTKQPDWTHGDRWSGQVPADKFDDHRASLPLED